MGHENIGYIAKAGREFTQRKGFKEGDLVFVEHYVSCGKCEWCHLGQYRHCENTNWRTNPDAHPLRLHLRREAAAPVGRLRAIRLPAVEFGDPSRAQGRHARARRARDADGERRRVVAVRRPGRLQLDGADPGARPAGPLADRDLQAGRRVADHRHRHRQGRRAAEGRQGARRRLRDRRAPRKIPSPASWRSPAARASTSSLDCTAGAGTIPILLGIEALKRKAGIIVAQGEMAQFPNFPLEKFTVKFITMKSARGHSYQGLRAGAASRSPPSASRWRRSRRIASD